MKTTFRLVLSLAVGSCVTAAAVMAEEPSREIVRGSDHFEFTYRATLPALDHAGRLLLPLAKSDAFQTVETVSIESPLPYRQIEDGACHNTILEFSPAPGDGGKSIEVRYRVRRREKEAHPAALADDPKRYLSPERLVPSDAAFRRLAAEATRDVAPGDEFARARALYQYVLGRMKYDKTGVGWGRGDALRACDARTGNCTDFHSYFIALARAEGIPARFAIGATIPADRDEGAIAGYHCWAEFFANSHWTPVDISEAWNHPTLAEYYFGHQPANRFELSAGRDLTVSPPIAGAGGSLNFLVYPYLEADGQEIKVPVEFRFRRLPVGAPPLAESRTTRIAAPAVAP